MKKYLVPIAVAVAAVTGVAAYTQVSWSRQTTAPLTARVTRGSVVDKVDATGTIQPVTTVQVGTQVSGTIKSLAADFNTKVKRGQVVAVLEPSLFRPRPRSPSCRPTPNARRLTSPTRRPSSAGRVS